MKLHPHSVASLAVTGVSATSLSVAQVEHHTSIAVHGSIGVQAWSKSNLTDIDESDIDAWVAARPELVVIGCGSKHSFLNPRLAVRLSNSGIGLECMSTPAAARTYNVLLDEGRDVLGAFLITP